MLKQLFITGSLFDKVLKIFLFFSPLIWIGSFQQSGLQMLVFNYGALVLFGLSISLPEKREFKNYNLALILGISILISLIKNPFSLSISFINIVFGCLLYYAVIRSTVDVEAITKIFIAVALLNIYMAITQICGLKLLYREYVICGFMAHKNHLAMFLALVSPILIRRTWTFIPLIMIMLLYLQCYAALLGFLSVLIVWLYFKSIKLRYKIFLAGILLLGLACLAMFVMPAYKTSSRVPVWEVILRESFGNPFLGHGLDSFKAYSNILTTSMLIVINSYSEYMRAIFEYGIFFTTLIGYFIFRYFKNIVSFGDRLSQALFASIISFLIMAGFQDVLHITRLAVPFIVILVLFEVLCLDKRKEIQC